MFRLDELSCIAEKAPTLDEGSAALFVAKSLEYLASEAADRSDPLVVTGHGAVLVSLGSASGASAPKYVPKLLDVVRPLCRDRYTCSGQAGTVAAALEAAGSLVRNHLVPLSLLPLSACPHPTKTVDSAARVAMLLFAPHLARIDAAVALCAGEPVCDEVYAYLAKGLASHDAVIVDAAVRSILAAIRQGMILSRPQSLAFDEWVWRHVESPALSEGALQACGDILGHVNTETVLSYVSRHCSAKMTRRCQDILAAVLGAALALVPDPLELLSAAVAPDALVGAAPAASDRAYVPRLVSKAVARWCAPFVAESQWDPLAQFLVLLLSGEGRDRQALLAALHMTAAVGSAARWPADAWRDLWDALVARAAESAAAANVASEAIGALLDNKYFGETVQSWCHDHMHRAPESPSVVCILRALSQATGPADMSSLCKAVACRRDEGLLLAASLMLRHASSVDAPWIGPVGTAAVDCLSALSKHSKLSNAMWRYVRSAASLFHAVPALAVPAECFSSFLDHFRKAPVTAGSFSAATAIVSLLVERAGGSSSVAGPAIEVGLSCIRFAAMEGIPARIDEDDWMSLVPIPLRAAEESFPAVFPRSSAQQAYSAPLSDLIKSLSRRGALDAVEGAMTSLFEPPLRDVGLWNASLLCYYRVRSEPLSMQLSQRLQKSIFAAALGSTSFSVRVVVSACLRYLSPAAGEVPVVSGSMRTETDAAHALTAELARLPRSPQLHNTVTRALTQHPYCRLLAQLALLAVGEQGVPESLRSVLWAARTDVTCAFILLHWTPGKSRFLLEQYIPSYLRASADLTDTRPSICAEHMNVFWEHVHKLELSCCGWQASASLLAEVLHQRDLTVEYSKEIIASVRHLLGAIQPGPTFDRLLGGVVSLCRDAEGPAASVDFSRRFLSVLVPLGRSPVADETAALTLLALLSTVGLVNIPAEIAHTTIRAFEDKIHRLVTRVLVENSWCPEAIGSPQRPPHLPPPSPTVLLRLMNPLVHAFPWSQDVVTDLCSIVLVVKQASMATVPGSLAWFKKKDHLLPVHLQAMESFGPDAMAAGPRALAQLPVPVTGRLMLGWLHAVRPEVDDETTLYVMCFLIKNAPSSSLQLIVLLFQRLSVQRLFEVLENRSARRLLQSVGSSAYCAWLASLPTLTDFVAQVLLIAMAPETIDHLHVQSFGRWVPRAAEGQVASLLGSFPVPATALVLAHISHHQTLLRVIAPLAAPVLFIAAVSTCSWTGDTKEVARSGVLMIAKEAPELFRRTVLALEEPTRLSLRRFLSSDDSSTQVPTTTSIQPATNPVPLPTAPAQGSRLRISIQSFK